MPGTAMRTSSNLAIERDENPQSTLTRAAIVQRTAGVGRLRRSKRARVCEQGAVRKNFLLYPHDLYPLIVNERERRTKTPLSDEPNKYEEFRAMASYIFGLLRRKIYLWLCRSLFTFSLPPGVKACAARTRAFVTMPLLRLRLSPIPGHKFVHKRTQPNKRENLSMATRCKQAI